MKKSKTLAVNTTLFAVSNFGAKFLSFFMLPLYTYILSAEEYGCVDIVTSTALLLIPLLTLNIQDAVLRYTIDKSYDSADVLGVSVKIIGYSALPLLLVLYVVMYLNIFNINDKYIVFMYVYYVAHSFYNVISMHLRAVDKVKVFAIGGFLSTLLTCLLNLTMLLWLKMGINGYLIANCLGTILSLAYMFIAGRVYKSISFKSKNDLIRDMLIYSSPLIVNSLAWWINNLSDRYILVYFCGAAINGVYSVSYKIPTILSSIQHVFYNAWSISAIKDFDRNDCDGFIGRTYMYYICASMLLCSFILLANIPVAKLLYAKEFYTAWKYVPLLLVGTVFNGLALFEGCIFTAVKQTSLISKTTVFGAIVNTILNILLIPFWGAYGAALATMFGYFSIWLVRAYKLRSIISMKIDIRVICTSVILLMTQCFISLYPSLILIQVIIIITLLILFKGYMKPIYLKIHSQIFRHKK